MAALAPAAAAALAPTLLAWLPCVASTGCCAANAACSVCCSCAACFGCNRHNAFLSKMLYVLIFFFSACLGIAMRYWGEQWLAGAAALASTALPGFCAAQQCWGMQAAYRISLAVAVFFAVLSACAAAVPVTHLGGWLVKLVLYVVLLGLAFLVPNDTMLQYADAARGFSVIFMLAQVLIIIDFAYNAHEFVVARMDARDSEFRASGFEPGLLSNCWGVLYVALSLSLLLGSLASLGVMYWAFGGQGACQLSQFFISETLVLGVMLTLVSLNDAVRKGLLPPAILFAYNTYLCFGALTNNPDATCNPTASGQNDAAIFTGLVIAALSVTWMAFSSAGQLYSVVQLEAADGDTHAASVGGVAGGSGGGGGGAASAAISQRNAAHGAGSSVAEWAGGKDKGSPTPAGSAAAYQQRDADEENALAQQAAPHSALAASGGGNVSARRDPGDDSGSDAALRSTHPWAFDLVMCLAGMYLAMLVTNWGSPQSSNSPAGNPELSLASMWVRIGTQMAIHVLFMWSLVAPLCCPGRDFGGPHSARRTAEDL